MVTDNFGRRRRGSVRFDAYAKNQWWDERSLTWRDIQVRFDTPELALAAQPDDGRTWRVMVVTMNGRHPWQPI